MRRTKYTIEEVKKISIKHGFDVLSNEYVEAHSKLKVRCVDCDKVQFKSFHNLRKRRCPYCNNKIKFTIDYVTSILKSHNFEMILDEYHDVDTPISTKCMKCGFIARKSLWNIKNGHGCKNCLGTVTLSD